MKRENYDLIICGGGAAGLLLALQLQQDSFFNHHSVLIIDKDKKDTNDRTWCFWEKEPGALEALVYHSWDQALFRSKGYENTLPLAPYSYKMIRGVDFYAHARQQLEQNDQFHWLTAHIDSLESHNSHTLVHTSEGVFTAPRVFSSLYQPKRAALQDRYPVLQQHFVGWIVETENHCFTPDQMTFMDFSVPQEGATRFMYVLPFTTNKALLEDTLFSAELLATQAYEKAIERYLEELNAGNYSIQEKEQGSIPMTAYPFHKHNTPSLLHIGTAGGWTKASTGYTFQNTLEQIQELIPFLKQNQPLHQFHRATKFGFYDMLFLDVLAKYNGMGSQLFTLMFQNNPVQRIFRFLDNKTHFGEDLLIMRSFPKRWFLSALWKRLF